MYNISFPGLGLHFTINPVAFKPFGFPIAWYGIIIAVGLLLAMAYGMKVAKKFNVTVDDLSDVIIFSLIFGIIGARLYYVLFYVDSTGVNPYFSNPLSIFDLRSGGLGIYGGILAAFATAFVVCKIKKISIGAVYDIAALGFLIGQAIGRWGNFVNQEAYGSTTNLPWGMRGTRIVDVNSNLITAHPCFLYESLWCILGFVLLHMYSKHRKFNGEVFLMYIVWYAFGRFFIEGLRSDSLMLGQLKVTQLVAAILFLAAGSLLVYKRIAVKKLVEQETAEYNPLFEETAKAVTAETAKAEDELNDENDSAEDNGKAVTNKPEDEKSKADDGKNTGDES